MKTKMNKKIIKLTLPDDVLRATRIFCAVAGISRSSLVESLWRGYLAGQIILDDQPATADQPATDQPLGVKEEL